MPQPFIAAYNVQNKWNGYIDISHLKLPFTRDSESYYWLMLLLYKPWRQPFYAEDAIKAEQPLIHKVNINKSQTAKEQCQIDKEMLLQKGAIFNVDFKVKLVQIDESGLDPFDKSNFKEITMMNSKLIQFIHAHKLKRLTRYFGYGDVGHPNLSIYYKPVTNKNSKLKLNRSAALLSLLTNMKFSVIDKEYRGRVIVVDPYNVLTTNRVIELMKYGGEIYDLADSASCESKSNDLSMYQEKIKKIAQKYQKQMTQ
eukprot:299056_1